MRQYLGTLIMAGSCAVFCHNAMAAHPLVTDDTSTQGQGNHQLEFNTDWLRDDETRARVAAITYSYGLKPNLDLVANVPISLSNPRGIGDVSLGAKWRFWKQQEASIGIKPELIFPTGDVGKELGTGRTSLAVSLLASREFAPWTLHANVGFLMNRYKDTARDEDSHRTVWRISTAASFAASDRTALVFNVGAARNVLRAIHANPAFALVGVIHSPTPDIDIDLGFKFGLNTAEVNRQFGAGITVRF